MKSKERVYARILRDQQISHGAFRLWHCLLDYTVKNRRVAFPSYETIRADISCSQKSLPKWIGELERAGWVKTERRHRKVNRYELLDDGKPFAGLTPQSSRLEGKSSTPQSSRVSNPQPTGMGRRSKEVHSNPPTSSAWGQKWGFKKEDCFA